MFHISGILNTRHGDKLTRCWLAGTVSEKVFKRKVNNHQITEYEIAEYCEDILRIFNDKMVRYRQHFSLHLFSHLMFGVIKLYSYQFLLFEKSVFRMVEKLDALDCGIGKQSTEKREKIRGAQLAKISQIPIDELLMPLTPELNLNRPFRRDINLLYEISPASHRRMIELDESNLVPFSPLTESQAKLWLSNDEGFLWTNMDSHQLPESERQPGEIEFLHPAAVEAARPDLPSRILRTPTKRTSTQKNDGTPSKRQRPSRIPHIDTMDEERRKVAASVVPMEQDGEPLPLPVEPMITDAAEDLMAPMDPAPSIFPMGQDVESHPLLEHQVPPVHPVPAILAMEQDVGPHPLPEHQLTTVPPVDQVENATVVARAVQPVEPARRLEYQGKKVKIFDENKKISEVKLKQRGKNVQAYTVSARTTRSVPTQKLVRTVLQLPSTIFKFGMENIRYNRLRKISVEVLRRYEINISGQFDVETDSSNVRPRDLPRRGKVNSLTVLGNGTDTGKSTENFTVIQPTEVDVARPDEVPQAEAADEPVFDTTGGAQFPLENNEQTGYALNISDATTVIGTGADTEKSTEDRTVFQPTKPNVAPPAEVPQGKAADEHACDPSSGAQLPLGNIDQTEHSENTSDTITARFRKVRISTDSAKSKGTDRRSNSSRSDWTMYSPRSKDQVKVEKSSSSKSRSAEEFIIDNGSELSSPRFGMTANAVWTRKDLEANLAVHWHDNNVISFEQVAPPNETSEFDATACFMHLLDMYKENKVILTQARTDAPIYIEKVVISDAMDWS